MILSGCSSITSQSEPVCPPIEYPTVSEKLLIYPDKPEMIKSNDPREAIKVIVENNNLMEGYRIQLEQLINEVRVIQESYSK